MREDFRDVMCAVALGAGLIGCSGQNLPPSPCGDTLSTPLSEHVLARLAGPRKPVLACRPAATGEVLINEVVSRPGGRDLDGDGKSSGRDEVVELVSLANEDIHLAGAKLLYKGSYRGEVVTASCMKPYTAALLVGASTASFQPPEGASIARLDKTLRLTDSGGALVLLGVATKPLDSVAVPLATDVTEGAVARRVDGGRDSELAPHAHLPHAEGRDWSPGTCANGEQFPECVSEGVIDREAYFRDARVP